MIFISNSSNLFKFSRFSSVTYQEASKMQAEAESAKKRKNADDLLV